MSTLTYRGITVEVTDDPSEDWRPDEKRVKNLIDLVDVVRKAPPPTFRMSGWATVENDAKLMPHINISHGLYRPSPRTMMAIGKLDKKVVHECGTSACAAGTGAFNGIGVTDANMVSWNSYVSDAFVPSNDDFVEEFLFGGGWPDSAEAAARRILWYLHEGQGTSIVVEYGNNVKIENGINPDWSPSTVTKKIQRYGKVAVLPKEDTP